MWSNEITNIKRTYDVNIQAQKTPYLISVSDNNYNSLKGLFTRTNNYEPAIFIDKKLDLSAITVFPLNPPFIAKDLGDELRKKWNEVLTFLGINNNPNEDKKERMIVGEVESNNEFIDDNVDYMLHERQTACEAINTLYGLSVNVKLRKEKQETEEPEEGGEEDEFTSNTDDK
jgi:hypothetical protein